MQVDLPAEVLRQRLPDSRRGPPRVDEDVVIEAASLRSDLVESRSAADLAQRDRYEADAAALAGEASSR